MFAYLGTDINLTIGDYGHDPQGKQLFWHKMLEFV